MKNRFAALDGLRAVAALGVLWIHCWSRFGAPRLVILNVDITSILALGGNGVDLFFVISGFCMYYFYANNKTYTYNDFFLFLKKRWIRLSPAFYTACLVYIVIAALNAPFPYFNSAIVSLAYLNGIFYSYTPESILWSLTTEWQFYIIVPFLLIYQNRIGFNRTFYSITGLLLIVALLSVVIFQSQSDDLTGQIIFRYFQFMWGIVVARIMLSLPDLKLNYRVAYLIGLVLIAYAGRIMIAKPILTLSLNYYNLFKLVGFTLMGLGFGGIIYLALTSKKWLKGLLGNPVISFIGKISFSFYLWHALVQRFVGDHITSLLPQAIGIQLPLLTFFASVIILIPLSTLSFNLLEKPFMARNHTK